MIKTIISASIITHDKKVNDELLRLLKDNFYIISVSDSIPIISKDEIILCTTIKYREL